MSKSILQKKRILTKAGGGSSLATPVSVANGGTGLSSYAVGDLIYASGATTLSKLADVAAGQFLLSGGVATAPAYSGTDLTYLSSVLTAPTLAARSTVNIGTDSSGGSPATGIMYFKNAGNTNYLGIQSGVTSASYTLTLPTAQGGASTFLQNNGSGVLSWAAASSGITVGTTTITSGTTLRIPYNLAGVYQEQANFTIGAVGTGILDVPVAYAAQGVTILKTGPSGSGYRGLAVGYLAGVTNLADHCTSVGYGANRSGTGIHVISIGAASNYNLGAFNTCLFIGSSSTSTGMDNTASNQAVIGTPHNNGYTQFYFGQGVSAVSGTPSGVTFNATPGTTAGGAFTILGGAGSGTNKVGGILTLGAGLGTGSGTPASIIFTTGTTLAGGTTAQTSTERLRVSELRVTASVPIKLMGYTVATLPTAPSVGDTAYVTDALAPTFLVAIAGGGAIVAPVFYDGVNWVAH